MPPNTRPWPDNMYYDFGLLTPPSNPEEFINSLPTSDRNKEFLLLCYRDGMQYKDIAPSYGITPSGVAFAVNSILKKFASTPEQSQSTPTKSDKPEQMQGNSDHVAQSGEKGSVLIVDPATLNGIALIETIRVLYRRVGPTDFEATLDELRDALCTTNSPEAQ